jgi:Ca2+-binding RTX toxin-like protein
VSGLTSGTNFNTIYYTGTTGDEVITGSALAETITGGTGSDLLTGGDGIDTYVFPTASGGTNGIDSIVFSNVSGSAVADIMDFTANDPFIGTVTESSLVISSVVTTTVSGAAGKNILFLTGSYFASASALAAVTTLFTNCDTGNVLIVYAENATANSRIAFCALNDAGNVTAATDVAILVGLTIDKASTGLGDGNFILN